MAASWMARRVLYHLPGSQGDVGFISTVSQPFCASCSRARLTADGRLRLCLLREKEVDLLTPMRDGASQEDLPRADPGGHLGQTLGSPAGGWQGAAQPDDERNRGIAG